TAYQVFPIDPTNLVAGTNLLAVEGHQTGTSSSDIVFGTALSTSTRGTYLQLATPTSIVVRWRSALPTDTQVIYGANLVALDKTNTISTVTTEHEANLTGLLPDTRYFYSVGCTTGVLSSASTD